MLTIAFHSPVYSLFYSENELVVGGDRVRVYDMRNMQQMHALPAHLQPIREVKRDDQNRVVCCSSDSLKAWDIRVVPDENR